jgi:hypothetical protein
MKQFQSSCALVSTFAALLLTACASTQLDAQWTNPDYRGKALRGMPVLVACEAQEPTLQRICEDQVSAQLAAQGATPTRNYQVAAVPATGTDPYQTAAKKVGARAIVRTTLIAGVPVATTGPQVGIGVGGSSGGYSGSTGGFGGISFPVGGTRVGSAYSGDTAVIDPANGAVMWSGRATSSTSQDMAGQVTELARVTVDAIRQAGFF